MLLLLLHSSFFVFSLTRASTDEVKVKPGEDVTLQCVSPEESAIRLLEWIRPDLKTQGDVFFYRNGRSYEKYQHLAFRGRVELRDPEMKSGDASVILKNVTVDDTGLYECRVISNSVSSERTGIESKFLLNLTVSDSVDPPRTSWEKGKTQRVVTNGRQDGHIGLFAGVSVGVLLLGLVGVIISIKYKKCQKLYRAPPENLT